MKLKQQQQQQQQQLQRTLFFTSRWKNFIEAAHPGVVADLWIGPVVMPGASQLTPELIERATKYVDPIRKQEYLCGALGRKWLTQELENGSKNEVRTSTAHGGGWVVVIAVAGPRDKKKIPSIGVDMELVTRVVSREVSDRICSEMGRKVEAQLEPRCLWCIKEAAYKADPDSEGHVLSEYLVTEWEGDLGKVQSPGGGLILVQYREELDLSMAFATLVLL